MSADVQSGSTQEAVPDSSVATDAVEQNGEPSEPQALQPKEVLYCEVCSFPVEYCEFGSSSSKCKDWLEEKHPNLYDQYYSDEAIKAKIGALSLEKQAEIEKAAAKAEAKASTKADAALKKKMGSRVTIKRIERNKRKFVTEIMGLEAFGLELKKTAKECGKKFACGSSVTKNPQGQEVIVIQGDVADDIMDLIADEDTKDFWKAIPEDNVVVVEDKKKKGAD